MLASFQRCGSLPVEKDLLKKKHRGDDKTLAHSFKMRGGRLSGPGDLKIFKFSNIFSTSFVLQRMFESLLLVVTYSNSGKLSQSSDVNTEEKKSFILSTMLRSFERVTPSTLSETRLFDPLRIDFTKLQNGLGLLLVASSSARSLM